MHRFHNAPKHVHMQVVHQLADYYGFQAFHASEQVNLIPATDLSYACLLSHSPKEANGAKHPSTQFMSRGSGPFLKCMHTYPWHAGLHERF